MIGLEARRAPGRTILVADASRTNRSVIAGRLGQLGHRILPAETGREALDLIAARGIDLVVIDMGLSGPSSIAVLSALRSDRATAEVPVIMITTRAAPTAAVEALAAGADDWIAKPFAFDALAARIERALARGARGTGPASPEPDRSRLLASVQALNDALERLSRGG